MVILTAADDRAGTDSYAKPQTDVVGFRVMVAASKAQAERFGYRMQIFDLGGLGMGEPFDVQDETFRAHGYYRQLSTSYHSKALHKPDLVAASLARHRDFTVYLDGDAMLWKPIDEVVGDYDVAVTVRHPRELKVQHAAFAENPEVLGLLNAGVIFFQPTAATDAFLARWKAETETSGSDQLALNRLLGPAAPSAVGTTVERSGVRVKYLSVDEYNYYYFDYGNRPAPDNVRIMHFKGQVRRFFRQYFP